MDHAGGQSKYQNIAVAGAGLEYEWCGFYPHLRWSMPSLRMAIDKPAIRRPQVMIMVGREMESAASLGPTITRNHDNGKHLARRGR